MIENALFRTLLEIALTAVADHNGGNVNECIELMFLRRWEMDVWCQSACNKCREANEWGCCHRFLGSTMYILSHLPNSLIILSGATQQGGATFFYNFNSVNIVECYTRISLT